ncbi:MAG: SDR family oxidoreductase [Chloroflexota bacterium]
MDPLPFANKIALITGSGRGIGRAIALHFAALGADIVINFFRNRAPAQQTAEQVQALGRRAWLARADIGDLDDLNRLFDEVQAGPGGLDFLVCNAASGYNRPVMEQRPKGWDWTMNINARAALFAAQRAAPLMEVRQGGAIVNLSSPGAGRVLPDYVVVGASKAALEAVTRYLAAELGPKNIVVNAISPGVVLTDALRSFDFARREQGLVEGVVQRTPAGRMVTPEDVAGLAAFLCTPAAAMIRGQVIVIDGGYTLY